MQCKSFNEFKKKLRKAIKAQSMKKFDKLSYSGCPFQFNQGHNRIIWCSGCPLSDTNGPRELIGNSKTCLVGSIQDICIAYDDLVMDKKTALARLVFSGTKLLAYLEGKENE